MRSERYLSNSQRISFLLFDVGIRNFYSIIILLLFSKKITLNELINLLFFINHQYDPSLRHHSYIFGQEG